MDLSSLSDKELMDLYKRGSQKDLSSMSDEQLMALYGRLAPPKPVETKEPEQKPEELGPLGRMGREFMHTIQSGYESAKAGIESTLEPDLEKKAEIFRKLQQQQEERERKEPSSLSFEKISKAYEQGLIPAAKEVLHQIPGAVGAGAASMIGAPVGAIAGSVIPGVGTGVGALAGMGATSFITQYGQNLQRQYEEQIKKGEKFDPEELKAAGWAGASAALDVGAFKIPFGKIFGKIGTEAAEKLAKESVAKSLAKGAVIGPLTEVPTEIVQQMMERYQAGMDLTSDDAIKEYNETAAQVVMGFFPMGAAGRYIERGRAKSFVAEQERKEEEAKKLIPGQEKYLAQRQAEFEQADAERRRQEELEGREAAQAAQPMLALPAPPEEGTPERDVLGRYRQPTRFTTEQDTEALLQSSKTPLERTTAEQRGNQFAVVGESGVPIQAGFKTIEDAKAASDQFNQRIDERNEAQKKEESDAQLGQYVELANKIRNAGSIPIFPDTGIKSFIFNRRMNRQGQPNVLGLDVPFTTPAEIQALELNQDRQLTIVQNKKNGRVEVKSGGPKPGELNLSDRLLQGQEPGIDVASGLTVPQREEVTAPEQVKEPALTPAAEKYLDQAQDRKDPTKFTPKNTEKVTNQLKALADKNGIELKKTVTENGVEKEVDKTPQDIVDDLVAKRNRQIQMAGVARETPSEPYGPAPRAPRTAVQIGAEKAQRSEQIASLLKSAFDKLGLTTQGVKPEVVRYIADESGKEQRGAQAVEAEYNPHTKTITFASDIYNPNLSVDQIVGKMMDVLNHEVVHSLKEAGLFKAGEWRVLENYVKSGEGRKFLERAKLVYPDLNEAQQIEEAIAEASRAFNAGEFKPVGKPRNLFQRIINFFKGLFGAAKNNNTTPDQIFNAIRTGEIGGREAGAPAGGGRMQSRVGPATKKEAFNKLASDQRGLPESAMINAQKIMGGGVLSNAIEHVGDLTHRMSEYGGEFARENVPTKVARVLRSLRNPYGFEREHKENIQAAARFRNIDPNKFNSELDDALDRYANEHKKLEVYNVMQDHAREAAISLGEKNFNKTEQHLSAIERALKSGMYARQVQEYNPDYPRRIHPDLQKKQSRVGPPGGIKVQLSTPQQQTQSNEINERLAINSKYLSKLTEEEGLRQVKGMRGWFKEFIDPYHALGEGADKYRIASGLLSGNMYKNINMARDYAEPIGAAKADKKNIYDYLTTRDSSPDIIKDQKAREAAIKVKDIINKIGDEAVRMGLISPEQRERFRDQYLPRVLLAYSDRRKHVGAGKKPGFGYWRKSRADLTEEERTQLGEIQDPGFLVFESLFAPMRDMAILSFFNKINEIGGGKWVVGMNNKPVKGLDMNIQQVKVYADRLENAIKNGEISEDRIAESSAEVLRLRNAVEQEEERIGASVDRDKFIQMPKDTERYGPLAGLWVAKPIYRDVMGVGAFVPNNMSEFAALFADGGAVAKASSWFKLAKVAANPPTVFTNIISNALMMPFADVPYHRILPLVASTFKEIMMDKKGKYFDIAQNYGLKSTTLSEAELKNLYSELEKRATGGSDLNKITNLFYALVETAKKGGKKASDFYGDIETVFKAAIIKHGMESQGLTEEQAVLKANKYLFDYGEVHDSIKVLRNIPFGAPFLTWTYKMTPLLVETALTKPQKFIPYVALYYGIAQLATMAIMGAGGSEDDKDKLKKYLAKKTAENPFVLVTGPDSAFDFGKYMPFTNMYKFAATMASGKPVDAFREIGFFGGPVAELGIALTTGKDPFTNMDITPKGGSFADSVVSWTNFIANIFMPPFMKDLPKLGAGYAIDDPTMVAKSQSAVADTLKQIFGGTSGKQAGLPVKTEWEIAASYIGANIYHPSMQQFARNLHTMTKEMQDITIEFRRSMQDPDLSQSDRNKIIAKYNQLRIDKQKEIMNYVKDSNLSPAVVKLMTDSIQATRKPQQ